jgi:hypothetical protein
MVMGSGIWHGYILSVMKSCAKWTRNSKNCHSAGNFLTLVKIYAKEIPYSGRARTQKKHDCMNVLLHVTMLFKILSILHKLLQPNEYTKQSETKL